MLFERSLAILFALFASVPAFGATAMAAFTSAPAKPDSRFKALQWREIGPYRGGRSAGIAREPAV